MARFVGLVCQKWVIIIICLCFLVMLLALDIPACIQFVNGKDKDDPDMIPKVIAMVLGFLAVLFGLLGACMENIWLSLIFCLLLISSLVKSFFDKEPLELYVLITLVILTLIDIFFVVDLCRISRVKNVIVDPETSTSTPTSQTNRT